MDEEPEELEEPEEQAPLEEEESALEEEAPLEEEIAPEEELPQEEEVTAEEEAPPEALLVSPDDVPVTLKVELGHLTMSADKLLSLTPGNLLELKCRPDSPVNLIVGGKRVGRGELMLMGETLGVRILELGK